MLYDEKEAFETTEEAESMFEEMKKQHGLEVTRELGHDDITSPW